MLVRWVYGFEKCGVWSRAHRAGDWRIWDAGVMGVEPVWEGWVGWVQGCASDAAREFSRRRFMKNLSVLILMFCVMGFRGVRGEGGGPKAIEVFVEEAMKGNPELKFYEQEIRAAQGQESAAAAWSNPEVSTKLGTMRVESLSRVKSGDGPAWQVSVAQTFEFPGRLALRKAIANRQVDLARIGLEQFRSALGMRVRLLAFRLLAAQERAEASRVVSQRFHDLLAVLVQRDPAGVAPMLATRVIEASSLSVGRRLAEAERELFNARAELNQLRGKPVREGVEVRRTPMVLQPGPTVDKLMGSARQRNFEVRARVAELEQQGFRVRLSENERWPAVTVAPYADGQKGSERQMEFGLNVSVPLPLLNRNQGNIETSRARQSQAEVALGVALRETERKLAEAAYSYELQLASMQRWPMDAAARFGEAAQLADQHYRLGAVPISTYVELQTQYLDAVDAMLNTQLDAMEARQQVEMLAGMTMEGLVVKYRTSLPMVRVKGLPETPGR